MKKIILLSIITVCLLTACVTTQSLDLTTLENNEFNLTEVVLMLNEDTAEGDMPEEFFITKFPGIIEQIKANLVSGNGLEINSTDFDLMLSDGSINIEKEVKDYGFIVHMYTWTNDKSFDQEVRIVLPFAVKENNTITATLNLSKDNPENPTNKLKENLLVDLHLVPNN